MKNPVVLKLTRLASFGHKRRNLGLSCDTVRPHCQIIPCVERQKSCDIFGGSNRSEIVKEKNNIRMRDEEKALM